MTPNATTPGAVFVSSTCLDLIDLRAALRIALQNAGLRPVLSDHPQSDFMNPGDRNAIETCLVNLRACEHYVLVLSQRYGGSLDALGYGNISATHLEYREAIRRGLPITVYVRDRLLADYESARRNKAYSPSWATSQEAPALFELIAEHEKHAKDKANWIWPFQTAADLCERILGDLGAVASTARLRMLAERNRLPQLDLEVGATPETARPARLVNTGTIPASRVRVLDTYGQETCAVPLLGAQNDHSFTFYFDFAHFSVAADFTPVLQVEHDIATGERVIDLFALLTTQTPGAVRAVPAGRSFVGNTIRMTSPTVRTERGVRGVSLDPLNKAYSPPRQ